MWKTLGNKLVILLQTFIAGKRGTIIRGIMWATASIFAKIGVEAPDESTQQKVGAWAIAVSIAFIASIWSFVKDKYLKEEVPSSTPKK